MGTKPSQANKTAAAESTENVFDGDNVAQGAGTKFARVGFVSLNTLKLADNGSVFVRCLEPMAIKLTTQKEKQKDAQGVEREVEVEKELTIIRVQDLQDKTPKQMVLGVVLGKELSAYKGGNQAYVGLCFEITKRPAAEGKRAKRYEIFEIADPDHKAI